MALGTELCWGAGNPRMATRNHSVNNVSCGGRPKQPNPAPDDVRPFEAQKVSMQSFMPSTLICNFYCSVVLRQRRQPTDRAGAVFLWPAGSHTVPLPLQRRMGMGMFSRERHIGVLLAGLYDRFGNPGRRCHTRRSFCCLAGLTAYVAAVDRIAGNSSLVTFTNTIIFDTQKAGFGHTRMPAGEELQNILAATAPMSC